MLTSMWFMSLATLLVVDVRTRALQPKDDVPHRCHHCANATACATSAAAVIQCPSDRPLCATSLVSPNFTSELTCAAAAKKPCSLTRAAHAYTLLCTCPGDLCNSPFSKDLQKQMLDFTSSNLTKSNSSDYTEAFFKLHFANVTDEKVYKAISIEAALATEKPAQFLFPPKNGSTAVTLTKPISVKMLPRAEAFKQEPTALSEDDEDASEGSGSYEDSKSARQPASDPADPSSFLPASENKAPSSALNFLVTTPILLYFLA